MEDLYAGQRETRSGEVEMRTYHRSVSVMVGQLVVEALERIEVIGVLGVAGPRSGGLGELVLGSQDLSRLLGQGAHQRVVLDGHAALDRLLVEAGQLRRREAQDHGTPRGSGRRRRLRHERLLLHDLREVEA